MTILSASQVRAARGLVGLTQAELGNLAGVNARTIIAIELGQNSPSRATTMRVEAAFRRLGVELIAEADGRGPGVRLLEPEGDALIISRHPLKGGQELGVVLRVAGRSMTARVAVAALAADGDTDAALEAFDCRRVAIANAVAKKLAAEAVDGDGHLRIGSADLCPAEQGVAA